MSCVTAYIFYLLTITYWDLSNLTFPPNQQYFICATIALSNFGLYSVFVQFKWACHYLHKRFQCINSLLRQLLFHEPLTDNCFLLETASSGNSKKDEFASTIFNPKSANTTFISHSSIVKGRFGKSHRPKALPSGEVRVLSQSEIEHIAKKMNIGTWKAMALPKM